MAHGAYCMQGAIVDAKNDFFDLNGNGMSQINMSSPNRASTTQSDKAQAHENQPMKYVK